MTDYLERIIIYIGNDVKKWSREWIIMKRCIGIFLMTVVTMVSFNFTEPVKAEASWGNLLGGLISAVVGLDESSIMDDYYDMVDNYYAAAYYSDRAAVVGGMLLNKYGVAVHSEQVALVNSSSDSSDGMVQRTANMKITTINTSLTSLDQFVEVAKNFNSDDELMRKFCAYKAIKDEALSRANSKAALLVGKRLLTRNYGRALGDCISTAIWYDGIKSRFADASGSSVSLLNQAIKQTYDVRVDKGKIKDAIKNVPRG